MMYKLHAPLIHSYDEKIQVIKKLFKEVLGYTEEEVDQFIKTGFACDVAINLSLEQARQIVQPFVDYDISICLYDQKTNEPLFWQKDLGIYLIPNEPKAHYYDEPVVSREHLVDPYNQREKERKNNVQQNRIEQNIKSTITCPYCKSTNTKKISGLSKAGSVALFGIFALGKTSKQWHCNSCNSDF